MRIICYPTLARQVINHALQRALVNIQALTQFAQGEGSFGALEFLQQFFYHN